MGMPALAATDHEGLYGAVRFYQACKAAGIKPIVGVELTVEPPVAADGRLDRKLDADDGLDASRLAGLVEAHGAVEPLVVCSRQGRHAHAAGPGGYRPRGALRR